MSHSPVDEIVEGDNARQIFEAARHPLTRRPDAAYVADVLSAWASRYLPDRTRLIDTDLLTGAEPVVP
ncbi:MAG: hypothetical protein U5K30_09680 [Acidimicrobiales bacterium]|nr:hypothetical protein [Acidimicrobiales bacterium]